ncbi:hypothetical protein B0H21DRAFT_725863 [Amylocystis lapponica]|nr:hypothetical protein B0H21DRAFT_725863 [Amylocystis lapponica]
MDNNQPNFHHFFQQLMDANPHVGQHIGNAIHTLMNGFVNPPPPHPDEYVDDDDPDLMDLPPLEPIPHDEVRDREATAPAEDSPNEGQSSTHDVSHSQSSDSVGPSQSHVAGASHDDLYAVMPPLEDISDSDSDVDMADVEMSVDPVETSEPADSAESVEPAEPDASTARNSRRARVDDGDDDDTRESNRQRMHSPHPHDDLHDPPPQWHPFLHEDEAGDAPLPPPLYSRVIYTLDFLPPPPADPPQQDGAPGDAQAHPHHDHHAHAHPHPVFNFSFNIPPTPAGGAHAPGAAAPTEPGPAPAAVPAGADTNGPVPPPVPDNMQNFIQQFFQRFMPEGVTVGDGAAFFAPGVPFGFGFPREEEQDDPERAKRLVAGLEEVSVGLVQRMERVGGPGTAEGDSPGCAICWEKLLDPEAGGFGLEDQPPSFEEAERVPSGAADASSTPRASSAPPYDDPEDSTEERPRVVALPCSHVFHASCLLPWFSKPHRTTCPSCRFDIDPESLTYVHRRRTQPRPQRPPTEAPAGAQPDAAQQPPAEPAPDAQPAPVPAPAPAPRDAPQPQATAGDNQPRGPRLPHPLIAVDFSLFIPVGGMMNMPMPPAPGTADAGPGPGPVPPPAFMTMGDQASRAMFERMFGARAGAAPPAPQPNQQPHQPQPQPQPQPQAQAAGPAPAPQDASGEPRQRPIVFPWQLFGMGAFGPNGPMPPRQEGAGAPGANLPNANANAPHPQTRPRPPEKRQWTLPPPPGPTLRQRIERKEREAGLRCWDVSCGLGPSDEDPVPVVDARAVRQIQIHPVGAEEGAACEHAFHPACLVSAERVAGWGAEDQKEEKEGERVEVSCPVCRAVGCISRTEWDEGACALA